MCIDNKSFEQLIVIFDKLYDTKVNQQSSNEM
jgi:hypothetical protein